VRVRVVSGTAKARLEGLGDGRAHQLEPGGDRFSVARSREAAMRAVNKAAVWTIPLMWTGSGQHDIAARITPSAICRATTGRGLGKLLLPAQGGPSDPIETQRPRHL
jgi:hypothetical protein